MNEFKKEIKTWLKRINKDRFWLADNTYTTKATVDGWMSSRGYIPPAKIDKIRELMRSTQREPSSFEQCRELWKAVGVLLTTEDYEIITQAAALDESDVDEWCARRLIEDALMRTRSSAPRILDYKAAEEPAEYGKKPSPGGGRR